LSEFLTNVTNLVEASYEANGQQKVILLCHSMGSIMMLNLLQSKPQAWKDKYIRALVTLAGVWGGTVRALKVYLLGIYIIFFRVHLANRVHKRHTSSGLIR